MSSITELASLARSAALQGAAAGRPFVLGIVGPPGSGKSTLTAALAAELGWSIVQMDGYHYANEVLLALGRRDRKGSPDTFDVDGFVALLARVRNSDNTIYAPRFVREIEEPVGSAMPVDCSGEGVIVEGNYLLLDTHGWATVAPLLDESWYVDTLASECYARLVERATLTYGPDAGPRWVETVDEPNAAIVRATAARATRRVVLAL